MSEVRVREARIQPGRALMAALLVLVVAAPVAAASIEFSDWSGANPIRMERDTPRLEFAAPRAAGAGWRTVRTSDGVTVLVESVGLSGDVPGDTDNDFTRIQEGISAAVTLGAGTTVRLAGTFDWTEPFAEADWVAADYGILMPGGVADITITAASLGSAVIQGPGELPDVYYEGFLFAWGTTYHGWTISNLDVRGFEWTFGFFYAGGAGGTAHDFDGFSLLDNRIEIPTDSNALAAGNPDEATQNIGIHLAFGDHQTIAGNEIVLAGDGLSDTANGAAAATVVLQSNSSGGNYEDSLLIADNLIRITGAQSADPEYVYGIWENFSAHAAGMTIRDNQFLNEHAGNDPALNRQLGFRLTSHSSATSTVAYLGNTVTGAHAGIGWLKYSSPYNPPSTALPILLTGNTLLDCATGVWVRSDNGNGKGTLLHNRFGQTTIGVEVENAAATSLDWWGCNEGPGAPDCAGTSVWAGGTLDAASWLELGFETLAPATEVGVAVPVPASLRESVSGNFALTFAPAAVAFAALPAGITSPHPIAAGLATATYTPVAAGVAAITATLDAETVDATMLVTSGGVVTVLSVAETGTPPSAADNDYTRINDAVQAMSSGVTVRLDGLFDWTEPFAAAAWALGSDGQPATGDEYGILAPFGFANVTLDAATLGDAIVQGPGDLPEVDLEAFLMTWGGTFQGWTFANLDIRGFDLGIGMFCCDGASVSDQYDGVAVVGNRFELPADWNAIAEPADAFQNIALHYAFGDGQTIQGNEFVLPGTGVSDTSDPDPANWRYASSVVMQSNTSGGATYDGLLIADNLIRVTGAQSADPERILGIWENAHGHQSDITVAGNQWVNEHPDNDPALNQQRAFRVTSHSSASSTVLYEGNRAAGAGIAIEMPYAPPGSVEPVILRSNDLVGNGRALQMVDANQNVVLAFNRLGGNVLAVDAQAGTLLAENNWWGCNEGPGAPDCDAFLAGGGATVDADPWLVLTLDVDDPVVEAGASTGVTAALIWNSDLEDTSPGGNFVPDGIAVDFAATGGSVAPPTADTVDGVATATFTAGALPGPYEVTATVDAETVGASGEVVPLGYLFIDGFESGDTSHWSDVVGLP
ncbi:MAG: hypothetical protein F9K16_08805 [Thermoanaerobaculia bacterium]|nr:MAG: hypothetical protein F9K16_08805 [Thermoanaerobaculia bacterium]MBZ0102389.1 Ig-like domain-containing protein [Thermoanaerobaculia bacterium]